MTKYIGEALRERTTTGQSGGENAVCMGIPLWNNITNNFDLIGLDKKREYDISKTFNTQHAYLDCNHTHFLMVDNNYAKNHNKTIDFSTSLITEMRKLQYDGKKFFFYATK